MKAKLVIAVLLTAVLLNSCIVKSLHPFYTEGTLAFRKDLMGAWMDQDGGKWQIKQFKKKKNADEITLVSGEGISYFPGTA